ncbi:hypothetical protein ACHAWF_018151 [Thalassiosira exigua]
MKRWVSLAVLLVLVAPSLVSASDAKQDEENSEYFFACSGGDLAAVTEKMDADPSLVHKTTKDGEHCLHLVAISGNSEIAKLLLDKGADPDIRSKWEKGLRMHPLSWSTFYGRYEIIELLLKHGADVNADFDFGGKENGEPAKGTVLDVVEQILLGSEDTENKERFIKTRNILVKNGALRYTSIEPEL